MTEKQRERLRKVKRFDQLLAFLRDELDWPIDDIEIDDLTFEYEPEELGIDAKNAAKIDSIKQLRPLRSSQPWGIFFFEFEPKRLPVIALRRILRALVIKRRQSTDQSERAVWHMNDLLFISNYGEGDNRHITFAHFTDSIDSGDLPSLRVLGWDDADTALHLDHVHCELTEKLHWPDDESDIEEWRKRWSSAFIERHREAITTSKQLAIRLADLARVIRKRANSVLAIESDKGPLKTLMSAFKDALIHDLSEDDFADMYAQTISYGLLSARVSRPAGLVAENLVDMVPITNPFLKELLETFLSVGGRKSLIDFDELGINNVVELLREANMEAVLRDFGDKNPEQDPVIHFYELFLKEYDAKKRMKRGVFYTPRPVVSFIVRSVDELLRTEFGLKDGFADTTTWEEMVTRNKDITLPEGTAPESPFVQILDPATGTGTFLVEVIDLIYKTMVAKWKAEGRLELEVPKLWNDYVPKHLLPRLHGYELMMAPYAIAHMKIGLKLYETGYRFGSDERARVYLTNSLEPAQDLSEKFEFMAPALAHEAKSVNAIKRDQRFTVVIGNPPYASLSQNMGGWIRDLVGIFRVINGVPIKEKGKRNHLQDDYVKFVRLGLMNLERARCGVCGLITNHSYLFSPTFRAMRYYIANTVTLGQFVDLNGNVKRNDAKRHPGDKNVFEIQQGVAISLLCKAPQRKIPQIMGCSVFGSREMKYRILSEDPSRLPFKLLMPKPKYYLFEAINEEERPPEYEYWLKLDEMMPLGGTGIKTNRDDFAIAFDDATLLERMRIFRDETIQDADAQRILNLKENYTWKIPKQRLLFRNDKNLDRVRNIDYRPFDRRRIYYHKNVVYNPRFKTMAQARQDNVFILSCRQQFETGFRHAYVTRQMFECCLVSAKSREITSGFPLYVNQQNDNENGLFTSRTRTLNFSHEYLDRIQLALGVSVTASADVKGRTQITGHDVLGFLYAILYSPCFRVRYSEFLKIDFPRLPIPGCLDLFYDLAQLGGELIALHLMESPKLYNLITTFVGSGDFHIEKVSYSNETVWLDKAKAKGFQGVPEEVWNFHIGGYQVCQKWLKDRGPKKGKPGRILTDEDINHYQKIVVALNETIRIMKEIDNVIEAHGGWPDAFKTEK